MSDKLDILEHVYAILMDNDVRTLTIPHSMHTREPILPLRIELAPDYIHEEDEDNCTGSRGPFKIFMEIVDSKLVIGNNDILTDDFIEIDLSDPDSLTFDKIHQGVKDYVIMFFKKSADAHRKDAEYFDKRLENLTSKDIWEGAY